MMLEMVATFCTEALMSPSQLFASRLARSHLSFAPFSPHILSRVRSFSSPSPFSPLPPSLSFKYSSADFAAARTSPSLLPILPYPMFSLMLAFCKAATTERTDELGLHYVRNYRRHLTTSDTRHLIWSLAPRTSSPASWVTTENRRLKLSLFTLLISTPSTLMIPLEGR